MTYIHHTSHLHFDEINFREVWGAFAVIDPALTIELNKIVAHPDVIGEFLCPAYLIVTDPKIIARNPDHRPPCTQC